MSKWSEFYKSRVGVEYSNYCRERYKPFIDEIRLGRLITIREEGCGIGTISRVLLEEGYRNISLFDLDAEQVELARENTFGLLPVYRGDILGYHADPAHIIFSHGVLEHFTDEQIKYILQRQKMSANKLVHYVPTDKYKEKSFGDERLMPTEWWVDKFEPTRIEEFNDNKDLILIWE